MRIFKFGGASVKDAESVKNVGKIVDEYGSRPLVVVISAMGKTTNQLENVLNKWWREEDYLPEIQTVKEYHSHILEGLFANQQHPIYEEIGEMFSGLKAFLETPPEDNYDYTYDQVISIGELVSTKIVSAYLNAVGIQNHWLDARDYIKTDELYREARVDWLETESRVMITVHAIAEVQVVVTQGFIGSTWDGHTTTLGREGSDYTAAIFANILNASELVIWKDVPGILNADPKKFADTVKFEHISYHEAIEMTYYGASVLHPKTIKPLQNKNIPLLVKSFIHPQEPGTAISGNLEPSKATAVIILKEKQVLLSLSALDYSFIAETNIERIFDEVVRYGLKVNIMHNSAISFNMCVDDRGPGMDDFIAALSPEFDIQKTEGHALLTIKYCKQDLLDNLLSGKKILLEMLSGDTVQYVLDTF